MIERMGLGRNLFSLAIAALGVETVLCAGLFDYSYSRERVYQVVPVIPWLPSAVPWLAYLFGAALTLCAVALYCKPARRAAAMAAGSLMFLGAILLDVPKYAAHLGDLSIRTAVFEPLALAALAWLLPDRNAIPPFLDRAGRYLLALSLLVFGIDHFLALAPIGTLVPNWIPWHVFWIAFFGTGFIAAGLSIGVNVLSRPAAACISLMFAIWVATLHAPSVLRAPQDPGRWSSLLVAIALSGGSWVLACERKVAIDGGNGVVIEVPPPAFYACANGSEPQRLRGPLGAAPLTLSGLTMPSPRRRLPPAATRPRRNGRPLRSTPRA